MTGLVLDRKIFALAKVAINCFSASMVSRGIGELGSYRMQGETSGTFLINLTLCRGIRLTNFLVNSGVLRLLQRSLWTLDLDVGFSRVISQQGLFLGLVGLYLKAFF